MKTNIKNIYINIHSLKYLITSLSAAVISTYFTLRIGKASNKGLQIPWFWSTIGTDFFGIIGQICFSQFGMRLFNKKGKRKVVCYLIPIGWALFHTFFETVGFFGYTNFDTKNGADFLDIGSYWLGALATVLLSIIYESKKASLF